MASLLHPRGGNPGVVIKVKPARSIIIKSNKICFYLRTISIREEITIPIRLEQWYRDDPSPYVIS